MSDTGAYYDGYWREGVNSWHVQAGLSRPMRRLLIATVAGRKVLDFGGGDGDRYGPLIRSYASQLSVADVSSEVLRSREARGDTPVRPDELERYQRQFDVLLALEVLEHVLDPLSMLSAATATLSEGGRAIISVPNAFSWLNRARMVLGRLPASGVGPPGCVRPQCLYNPHIRCWDTASLLDLCARAGLSVDSVHADGIDAWRFSEWVPERLYPLSLKRESSLVAHTLVLQAHRTI